MPHQCTNCGHTFPDGSKEMLSGCPDCGGNKFQFKPAGSTDDKSTQPAATTEATQPETTAEPTQSAPETAESPPETEGVEDDSGFVSKELKNTDESPAQSSARSDVVSSSELTAAGAAASGGTDDAEAATDQPTDLDSDPPADSDSDPPADSDSDLPADPDSEPAADHPVDDSEFEESNDSEIEASDETKSAESADTETEESNLDELRKELNNQFESIRIVSPGQYELNLMELYDREEYIISLREDGRYVIEVPDGWGDS